MNKINLLLIRVAGYDNQTALQCTSSEIKKLSIAGMMVLIPALLALFSYSYAFYFFCGNAFLAICGGILSAIVLLIIDRSIMAYGRPGTFSFGLIGRALLAIAIGFLLAEPIVLKIFEDSIEEQLFVKQEKAKADKNAELNEKILLIKNDLNSRREHLDKLQEAYTGEMDGTSGSKLRNQGPIYQQKYNDFKAYQTEFLRYQTIADFEMQNIQKEKELFALALENKNAQGFIGRMRALSELGSKESVVFWTTWLLRLFFMLIELLPLLIKISPTGDLGLYYKILDMNDLEQKRILELSSQERLEYRQKEEKLRITKALAELYFKQIQTVIDSKEKDSIYLMDKVLNISQKKMDLISKAMNIKEKSLLEEVLAQFGQIHEGFMLTVNDLIEKSKLNSQMIIYEK
nr:DUF4407 domain-containing protein [uncultured Capnocytophaga sp.]